MYYLGEIVRGDMKIRSFGLSLGCCIIFSVFVFCGCSHPKPKELFPAGSLMSKTIRFQYAVYMLPKHAKDPSVVLRQALKRNFAQLKLVDKLPEEPNETLVHERVEANVSEKYAVPSNKSLSYSGQGLTAKQIHLLRNSQEAYILDFAHPSSSVWNALRNEGPTH